MPASVRPPQQSVATHTHTPIHMSAWRQSATGPSSNTSSQTHSSLPSQHPPHNPPSHPIQAQAPSSAHPVGCVAVSNSRLKKKGYRFYQAAIALVTLALGLVSLFIYALRSYKLAIWTAHNDLLQACIGLAQVRYLRCNHPTRICTDARHRCSRTERPMRDARGLWPMDQTPHPTVV